jgi:hypothetical protein
VAEEEIFPPENTDHHEFRGRREDRPASRYRGHSHGHSRAQSHVTHSSAASPHRPDGGALDGDAASSMAGAADWGDDWSSDGDEDDQDIEEMWFPGGHADIGGGWEVTPNEVPLSHIPMVWIVSEARKSGLAFDEHKMEALDCLDDTSTGANMPTIEVSSTAGEEKVISAGGVELGNKTHFKRILMETATKGQLHDCLRLGKGLPWGSVVRWRLMEWMPFRRLDLTEDGKWKPIRWSVSLFSLTMDSLLIVSQAAATR